jgi:hypothetical protein
MIAGGRGAIHCSGALVVSLWSTELDVDVSGLDIPVDHPAGLGASSNWGGNIKFGTGSI